MVDGAILTFGEKQEVNTHIGKRSKEGYKVDHHVFLHGTAPHVRLNLVVLALLPDNVEIILTPGRSRTAQCK